MFTGIVLAVFIEKAETLAWRSTDYYVCFGDFSLRIFKNIDYVSDNTMIPEVGIVSLCCIVIKIISPDRFEAVTGQLGKSEGHSAGTSKKIN